MRVLKFAVATELATGLALLLAPAGVAALLLGVELPGVAPFLARCFGITLMALSVACWPGTAPSVAPTQPLRGMVLYNVLITVCLACAGVVTRLHGPLLWPAVALHAVVAFLLIRPRSTQPSVH